MKETILAIDTSMNGCSVGLGHAAGMAVRQVEMVRGQAEALVPLIQEVLEEAALGFEALTRIVTTIGPGSFTGLRVGMSTSKSLALALDVPLIGVGTLETLAQGLGKPCLVVTETKREDFYVQAFDLGIAELQEPQALMAEEIEAHLTGCACAIVGDACDRIQTYLKGDGFVYYNKALTDPSVMINLMQNRLDQIGATKPLYLRDADVSVSKSPQRQIKL